MMQKGIANNLFRITAVTLCLLLFSGCEFRHYTEIVPVSGYFHTPEGKVKFKKITDKQFDTYFPNRNVRRQKEAILIAEGENIKLFYCAMFCRPRFNLIIAQPNENANGIILADGFTYQSGTTILRTPRVGYYGSEKDIRFKLWRTFLSDEGSNYFYTPVMISGPLGSTTPEVLNETHSMTIPIEIDGVPYLADFTFKIKSSRRLVLNIGTSATP